MNAAASRPRSFIATGGACYVEQSLRLHVVHRRHKGWGAASEASHTCQCSALLQCLRMLLASRNKLNFPPCWRLLRKREH
jgi:hypothetical protein